MVVTDSDVPDVTFRGVREGDEPGLLELIHAAFGESWPKLPIGGAPLDYLRWKIRSPRGDTTRSTVGEIDGRLVALSVDVTREGVLRGEKYLVAAGGGDVCVHPEFQGRGVYRRLRSAEDAASRQHHSFGLGNSTNATVLGTRQSRGVYSIVQPFDDMLKPLPTWRMGGDRLSPKRLARTARFRFRQAASSLRWRGYGEPVTVDVREVDSFDDRMDAFSDAAAAQFDLTLSRDAAFLNWRYCDPRAGSFRKAVIAEEGRVLGFSVARLREDACYVGDLLALPGRLDVVRALVEDVVAFGGRARMPAVVCALPRYHPYMPVLRRLGFVHTRTDLTRAYTPWEMTEELAFLGSDSRSRLHFTAGDLDVF